MPVATNVSTYFDDYSEDKNFHRVLFKPGVAVQSRELTQVQTILQNQVKRVGDYLFTDGAKVTGSKPSVNLDARTVRLGDTNISGQVINISNFLGKYVVGETTDVIGYVDFVFEKDDPVIGDPKSIVISLKKYNTTNNGNGGIGGDGGIGGGGGGGGTGTNTTGGTGGSGGRGGNGLVIISWW